MLKTKLANNELTIGSWLTMNETNIVEIMAQAGFEWLCIDIEHTSIDLEATKQLIISIQASKMKALVRVSKNEEVIIKRVMDMGADGVVVPMVNSESDARKAVSFVRYPPYGKRGVGLSRAQGFGANFDGYKKWVLEEAIVVAQIEHIDAVNNIDQILAVDGIDATIIGPYDLSGSLGFPGEYEREDVKKAISKVKDACMKAGKPYGFHVIESAPDNMVRRIEEGARFLAYSTDFFFLGDCAKSGMNALKAVQKNNL